MVVWLLRFRVHDFFREIPKELVVLESVSGVHFNCPVIDLTHLACVRVKLKMKKISMVIVRRGWNEIFHVAGGFGISSCHGIFAV